jgi:hypothetical protein
VSRYQTPVFAKAESGCRIFHDYPYRSVVVRC